MKKAEVQIGARYTTKQHGEVVALEANREKIFCRVVATGEIDLMGYRKLQPAPEPQVESQPARDEAEHTVRVMARLDRRRMGQHAKRLPSPRRIGVIAKLAATAAAFLIGLAAGAGPLAAIQ